MALLREKTELQSQLDENEEDYNDVMKKYKAVVQQASLDQNMISQQSQQIEELSTDRERLKQEVRGTPGGYSIDWKYLTMNKGHTRVTPQIEKKGHVWWTLGAHQGRFDIWKYITHVQRDTRDHQQTE